MPILDYRAIYNYIDNSLPNDLATQRRHCWEYMYTMGQPVVIRTVFDQDELQVSGASADPTFDDVYGQGMTWASTDKGQPFGFGSAIFTYIVLGDALVDDQTPNKTGEFKIMMPSMVAPWTPHIKDGDLIISVDVSFSGGTVVINGTGDRYQVQQVEPVTMRALFRQNSPYLERNYNYIENTDIIVQQNMQAVRLERTNPLYQISVEGN